MKKIAFALAVALLSGCYERQTLEHPQYGAYRPSEEAILTSTNQLYLQAGDSFVSIDLPKEFAKFSVPNATVRSVAEKSPNWKDYTKGRTPALPNDTYQKVKVVIDWSTGYDRVASLSKMTALGFSRGDVVYLYDWYRIDRRAWMHFRVYSARFVDFGSTDFLIEVPVKITHEWRKFNIDG